MQYLEHLPARESDNQNNPIKTHFFLVVLAPAVWLFFSQSSFFLATLYSSGTVLFTLLSTDLHLKVKGSSGAAKNQSRIREPHATHGKAQSFLETSLMSLDQFLQPFRDPAHLAPLHASPALQEITTGDRHYSAT